MKQYAASVVSNLFRFSAFIFLRVLPHANLPFVLSTLYITYIFLWLPSAQAKEPVANGSAAKGHSEKGKKQERKPSAEKTSYVNAIWTVLLSAPTKSRRLRHLSVTINSFILLLVLDFVFHPLFDPALDVTFARVGAVYPDGVKIHVRYPIVDANETSIKVVYRLLEKPGVVPEAKWNEAQTMHLSADFDWTNVTHISGLFPSTEYEYKLVPADEPSMFLSYPTQALRFKTFPDPAVQSGAHFRFLSTSCMLPNFPYIPGNSRRLKGFDYLAEYLWPLNEPTTLTNGTISDNEILLEANDTSSSSNAQQILKVPNGSSASQDVPVEFMLFLGDFIYADVPSYFGDDKEAYRRLYRRNYASPNFRKVYEKLPIVHIYDDHEFIDNFSGMSNDTAPYINAANAAHLYNLNANYDAVSDGVNYYTFRYGDAAFFVLDTRRYRSGIHPDDPNDLTMLGSEQITALHKWLGAVNQTASFKFVVSSVPFTSLWSHDAAEDSWAGYAAEKAALLKVLHTVPNVVILSGDRHEFAAIEFNAEGAGWHKVLEFSTSPLSMFYVPLYHTLNMESKEHVEVIKSSESGEQVTELVPAEKVLSYIPYGSHKWASLEVDSTNASAPVLKVEIYIDGQLGYTQTIVGEPVHRTSSAIGVYIPNSVKHLLNNIGLKPDHWF